MSKYVVTCTYSADAGYYGTKNVVYCIADSEELAKEICKRKNQEDGNLPGHAEYCNYRYDPLDRYSVANAQKKDEHSIISVFFDIRKIKPKEFLEELVKATPNPQYPIPVKDIDELDGCKVNFYGKFITKKGKISIEAVAHIPIKKDKEYKEKDIVKQALKLVTKAWVKDGMEDKFKDKIKKELKKHNLK